MVAVGERGTVKSVNMQMSSGRSPVYLVVDLEPSHCNRRQLPVSAIAPSPVPDPRSRPTHPPPPAHPPSLSTPPTAPLHPPGACLARASTLGAPHPTVSRVSSIAADRQAATAIGATIDQQCSTSRLRNHGRVAHIAYEERTAGFGNLVLLATQRPLIQRGRCPYESQLISPAPLAPILPAPISRPRSPP